MIRIAHVKSFYGQIGGIESMLEGVMAELAGRGDVATRMVQVTHLRDAAMEARLTAGGRIPLDVVDWTGLRRLNDTARRLADLLVAEGTDAMHSHDMRANLLCYLVRRRTGIPWIAHVHGWLGHTHKPLYRFYEEVDRRLIRRADHVLVGSHATLDEVRRAGARAASVLWNAVPMPADPPAPGADPVVIAMLGRLHYGKGQDLLIDALARLDPALPWRAVLVGAGDAETEAALDARIAGHGLGGRVTRTGFVDSTAPYLAEAGIVAVPSRKESLPLTCLEGMAWGRAVVVSEAGDLPRVVRDGETGRVVPIGDVSALAAALDALVRDAALRVRLGGAARRHIAGHHTAARLADDMVRVASDLVAVPQRQAS